MEPVKVTLGNHGSCVHGNCRFVKGELKEGDELIVRSVMPKINGAGGREFGAENLPAY